ncbi:hypothetical protein ACO34A_15275 [Rhizobium sp. ACO-34A]|nr:hypothetical protein ACO34A_15275 [Rhizobium sp. ACO-34A]
MAVAAEEEKQAVDISERESLVIIGSGSDDRLSGNEKDQVFYGGSGSDTFVFSSYSGRDAIADFDVASDVLELHLEQTDSIVEILGRSSQNGGDAVLNIDVNTSVTLWGVDLTSLGNDNFRLALTA